MYGDDITLLLDDGDILIRAQFIRQNEFGSYLPELAYTLTNRTSSPWRTLKLQFDIGGLCNGERRQWTVPVVTSLGWAEDHQLVREYRDTVTPLVGEVDGCKAEIIKGSLLLAESFKIRIDGVLHERVDLAKELQEVKINHGAEAAAEAEEERKAAEAKAKSDAAELARRKRLAAERKRNALLAQKRAEEAEAAVLPDGIMVNRSENSSRVDQYARIIAMYGRPERDDSTENDVPRPAMVIRLIEYRPENVKIAFLPIANFGDPPPFRKWSVIGFIDMNTNNKMSKYEAAERLKERLRRW